MTDGVKQEQHLALQQQVDYLPQRAADLVTRTGYLRGWLELQNTAVNSYLALRLAESSKSVAVASWVEGTMVKCIAIFGLVFVPAASIAVRFCSLFLFGFLRSS